MIETHELIARHKKVLALISERKFETALGLINECIEISRKTALNYFLKGRIYDEMLDYPASIKAYEKCIARDPNNQKAKFYLGLTYLALEKFEPGCRYYTFRHEPEILRKFSALKPWSAKVKPGKVLLWSEQGIGDEVMFLRFLPFLETHSHCFTLQCDQRLIPILELNYPWLNFTPRGSALNLTQFDYHLPIGDLLGLFHKKFREVSHQFLAVRSNQKVKSLVENYKGLSLIGLSWLSMNEEYGQRRSWPVEALLEGLDPHNIAVVALQYLAPKSEIDKIRARGFQVIDDIDCHQDIDAVFSIMSHCEKIITIDNSIAHFAGALGLETDIWLPNLPNWRWGLEKAKTYWYPSVTLKRFD